MNKAQIIFNKLAENKFTSDKAKDYYRSAAGGFLSGAIGSSIPTLITYPIDTYNIKQQAGTITKGTKIPIKELYKGIGTKMLKTVASMGLTLAIAAPLAKYISSRKAFKPRTSTNNEQTMAIG